MPKILFSYDGHDPNSRGHTPFKDCLKRLGWVDFVVSNNFYTQLPNTTLIVNKTIEKIFADIETAIAAAREKDDNFEAVKHVMTLYELLISLDIDGDDANKAQILKYKAAMGGFRSSFYHPGNPAQAVSITASRRADLSGARSATRRIARHIAARPPNAPRARPCRLIAAR